MEIIGTGLSGLVGSRIVQLNPDINFTDLSLNSGFDILKSETLEPVFFDFSGDTVIHLAAFTDTNAAWNQKGDKAGLCYQLNVVGTQNIVDMCQKYGKHLIHISTDYIFDGSKNLSYIETDLANPLDWYGETKLLAEQIIPQEFTIIRIASPYRAQFDQKTDLVRKIISKLKNNEVCKLFTDQITTPTFIDDIALGLAKVITNPKSGVYHLVGSSSQSVYDMGLQIAKVFGFDQNLVQPSSLIEYLKTPDARPYPQNLAISNQKFITEFGYTPKTLTEGLVSLQNQLA
ncbi:MAG: NAD(P)-dependent oxidoreductase [Candidatus Shapirobacteria bacterium]